MKRILLYLGISLGFMACQVEKVPVYSDVDRINFVGRGEMDEDDPSYMFIEKNFLSEQGDEWDYQLQVKVQGRPAEEDREVYFVVRDSTTPGIKVKFGECIIPAGELRGTCTLTVERPENEEELISLIGIDYAQSDFERGTYDRQEFMVKISDKISYDVLGIYEGWWEENLLDFSLGNWSFTKARFICNTLGISDFYVWYNDPESWDAWGLTCYDLDVLVKALEDYKANPENPPLYDETLYPEEEWISFDVEW